MISKEIQNQIDCEIQATQYEINSASLSDLNCDYFWNMYLCIDTDYIRDNVEENYADFIGTGTVEVFDGYYIFLM